MDGGRQPLERVPVVFPAVKTGKGNKSLTASESSDCTSPPTGQGNATSRRHIAQREPAYLREISSQPRAVTEWPTDLGEERAALGACFVGQAADSARLLLPDDFSLAAHREIFVAVCALVAQGETALEEVLIAGELRRRDALDAAGGLCYLSDLADGVVLARPMESRAKRLHEFAERRRLLIASAELARRARDLTTPVSEIRVWLREVIAQ